MSARRRFDQLRITPGAFYIIAAEVALSLIWLLSAPALRAQIAAYTIATPDHVFVHARVWTLVTTHFLELQFISLLLHGLMMWMFVPTLERFWGTARFFRFFVITSLVGAICGVAAGWVIGGPQVQAPVAGLDAFMMAAIVAFGIVYGRQPVSFFGVLPLTGRQMMWGLIAVQVLFVVLGRHWAMGAALAGAMVAAAILTSKRVSPGLAFKRWQIARARKKLSVIDGGKKPPKRDEQKWLN